MKFKSLLIALLSVLVLSSCGTAKKVGISNDYTNGSMTGSVISKLNSEYEKFGSIDLSNVQNILNLSSLNSSLVSLKGDISNQTVKDFSTGLEVGSLSLVNNDNVKAVVSGLTKLVNSDFTSVTRLLEKGKVNVPEVLQMKGDIESILDLLKK